MASSRKGPIRAAFVAAVLLSSAGVAWAAGNYVLVNLPFSRGAGTHAIITSTQAVMCGGDPEGCNSNNRVTFGPITAASTGTTIWRDTSSPNFDNLVALLTNGVNDKFSVMVANSGNFGFETTVLGSHVGPNGIDLRGFIIDRIGYRVDGATFVTPGSNPVGDGIWTDYSVQGAYIIEGTCATLPVIKAPEDLRVYSCPTTPTPFTLTPPTKYGSACCKKPKLAAVLWIGRRQVEITSPTLSLLPGEYAIDWIIDDGFNVVRARQNVTVLSNPRLCTKPPPF